ncbi:MAG: squalene synthase HpnC, partial [Pirellulales bacterium]
PPTLDEAKAYCRRLAQTHYENFTVASWLLPRKLRQHFYHVYAYCRWADDLADEAPDAATSLQLLDWWEGELRACYEGRSRHPVYLALGETIREFEIPIEPLADLLTAFRQDQHVTRYESCLDLDGYCRNSANPVGRLVLYLGRAHDEQNGRLSDAVCTGLQLANFCQDVAGDWDRGRVYLPQDVCRRFGYAESDFAQRRYNERFRQVMRHETDRAEHYLLSGRPLVGRVPRDLAVDLALFIEGGLAILRAIRRIDYDVWKRRPRVGKLTQARLLAQCWWSTRGGRGPKGTA